MANEEDSKIDAEMRYSVSHLWELHEKLEDKILNLMEEINKMTDVEREIIKASLEILIKEREELRKLLEDHAVFLNARNRNISFETKKLRLNFLKECIEKFKNLDLGNQETKSSDNFSVQERGEGGNSSWYVADAESKQKDPIFSLDDSDTSKEEEMEVWNEKNVDPDMKRRFLEKVKGSFSSGDEMETDIEKSSDAFDDQGSSTNVRELSVQSDLLIAGNSEEECSGGVKEDCRNDADMEYSGDDGQFLSNIDGLVEDLKRLGEEEDK